MILSAQSLYKKYKHRMVVNSISIKVSQGEIVGLLGQNGAGKTTTFYMTVGLIEPYDGNIYLDRRDITKEPMYKRARAGIGYLPQESSIFRGLTVEENLMAIAQMLPISKRQRQEKVDSLLEDFTSATSGCISLCSSIFSSPCILTDFCSFSGSP